MQNLRNSQVEEVFSIQLKLYHDPSLDITAAMSHVISSEMSMSVQRLLRLVESDEGTTVHVRWCGMPEAEDTIKPVREVFEDSIQLLE